MMRALFTLLTFISVVFFPWPLTAFLALIVAFSEPLVPLAIGIFADTLYYAPSASLVPFFTLCGALVTILSLFVHSRLRTGSIQG